MTEINAHYDTEIQRKDLLLGDLRRIFTANLAGLLTLMIDAGYAPMIGRDGEIHKAGSLHFDGLAVDIILTKDRLVMSDTLDHYIFGQRWKELDADNCWGGDFKDQDGNHYSMSYQGKK